MKKTLTIYKIAMISMAVCMFAMLLGMGMIAIQKSMTLKIDFNVNPSFEIRIDYGGNTIFCNTTKGGNQIATSNYFLLSGDTLTFQNSFTSLGESFTLTIYNYSSKYVKVTPSGTGVSGDSVILSKYGEEGSSDDLLFSILSGTNEIILTFEEVSVYTISSNSTSGNYTLSGTSSVVEGSSYTARLTTVSDYELPDSIEITLGGIILNSGYTWTKTDAHLGTLTINNVTGNVGINCKAEKMFVLTLNFNTHSSSTINVDPLSKTYILSYSITLPYVITIEYGYKTTLRQTHSASYGRPPITFTFNYDTVQSNIITFTINSWTSYKGEDFTLTYNITFRGSIVS